tara:strand:- start:1244 stop:1972 length:729 start_codon:yes stop_codon:yes gene_type:complete
MFDGKQILVTGANGGIGSCLLNILLDAEANVIAVDQNINELEAISSKHKATRNLKIIQSNLSNEEEIRRTLEGVESLYGLVHLAGIFEPDHFEQGDTENIFDPTIDANVRNFYSLYIFARSALLQNEGARIVLCSSVAFNRGAILHTAYSGAKGAIVGIARSLSRREAPDILVNAVAPGIIHTKMVNDLVNIRGSENIKNEIPLKRFGTAREVSSVIKFLLSKDASYITGQVINVDGGMVSG